MTVVNKKSHNTLADHIFKTLGRVLEGEGSFQGGSRAVTRFLTKTVGLDSTSLVVYDGSGLSAFNRVSAGDFVALLSYMADQPNWDVFWATLPEAGNPRELRRMGGTSAAGNLRAKTGTIRSVSALSGVVRTTNGERVAFSIISNEVPSTGGVKRIEDRIGSRLAAFGRPLATGAEAGTLAMANEAPQEPSTLGGDEGSAAPTASAASSANAAPTAETAPEPGADAPAAKPVTHRVQAGENFSVIAKRYGIPLNTLLEANANLSPKRLQVGTTLTIPPVTPRR
jgi:LysM repeat protein